MKQTSIILGLAVLLLIGCAEPFTPEGLYDYQIARLLTGENSKTWAVNSEIINGSSQSPQNCADSSFYYFQPLGDSIDAHLLLQNCIKINTYDSSYIGRFLPSSEELVFTDSLNFSNGEFWILVNITSEEATIIDGESTFLLSPVN